MNAPALTDLLTPTPSRDTRDGRPGEVAIEVHGLVKSYGRVRVVDGLDLAVPDGECFALLGPNGAGKTTTIEILEGFRRRDGGTVHVLGSDPARAGRGWRARVGVVGQTQSGDLDLSVEEMVRHFARYHAAPHGTDELIASVGLDGQRSTRVAALSGGQRRRLDVALGVQGRPDLLFLDEPTTGMDPLARRGFWALIEGLKAEGTTIVLTTHYLDEAAQLADRVGVISCGRLVEVAVPSELGAGLDLPTEVRWSDGGRPRAIRTAVPTAVVRDLLASAPQGELPDLSIVRPTLEDAYLALLDLAAQPRTGEHAGAGHPTPPADTRHLPGDLS